MWQVMFLDKYIALLYSVVVLWHTVVQLNWLVQVIDITVENKRYNTQPITERGPKWDRYSSKIETEWDIAVV